MNKALQTMEWMTPGANLNAYIQGTATVPILSLDEEKSLGEALYYDDDLDAARKLVMSHLRFVVHIARSYNGYGLPLADLIQEGNVGLMKAVRRFNPEKGVRVVSFAVHWIKAEIHEYILKNWKLVKVATTKAQRKLFFNLRKNKRVEGQIDGQEAARIAQLLEVAETDVIEMDQRMRARDPGFDQRDDEDVSAPEHYLQHESAGPSELVEQAQEQLVRSEQLNEALGTLDTRSLQIVRSRWLTDDKIALKTLAAEFGISIERVRQLEAQALKKLQGWVAG